ncbi:MAG: tetratricopeptide repeat protein [Myxococcales bacterium]|nr:tetratricopeptide repeat protein [Myxococcales bacterium]
MRALSLIAAAALATASSSASAGEPAPPEVIPAKARALADRGRAYHDAGDYGNAIIAFKEAYVMAPSPGLLFNLAQAYRLQGNCDDAALMYRRYLATAPGRESRSIAEGHLDAVQRCAHEASLGIPQDAGSPLVIETDRASGSLFATAPPPRRAQLQKDIGLGLTIGGAIALGVGAFYWNRAADAQDAVEDGYERGAKWKDLEALDTRGRDSSRMAKIFGIGGGVAIAGGVTLYLLGRRAERIAPISVAPAKRGATVNVSWQF